MQQNLRALLREVGLKVGAPSRKDFPACVRRLTADEPVLANLVESLLSMVEVMTKVEERLTKRVLDEVKAEPMCRRLMTVPGVGTTAQTEEGLPVGSFRNYRSLGGVGILNTIMAV
jgi:transposase